MYVWLDALNNYVTACGFPDETAPRWKYWPADVHMVGKDIIRFHAVYWPAFLMSAGLPLPRRISSNGWWVAEGEKMSKSLGNVIEARQLAATYGLDQVRYFLLREKPFGADGSISHQAMVTRINVELANDLGNLAQRSLSLIARNCAGRLPGRGPANEDDAELLKAAEALPGVVRERLDRQMFHEALEEVWKVVRAANGYIDHQAPWALNSTDKARMGAVLRVLADTLRVIATVLQPFMPESMGRMLDQLGVPADARAIWRLSTYRWPTVSTAGAAGRVPALCGAGRLMLIDSHCHLDYYTDAERPDVLARAAAAGVGEMVTIGTTLAQSQRLAGDRRGAAEPVVHRRRSSASRRARHRFRPRKHIAALTSHPKVIGIGESGLDYFYDRSPRDVQQAEFPRPYPRRPAGRPAARHPRPRRRRRHRRLSCRMNGIPAESSSFLLHCFSSSRALAEAALAMGGCVSFSGILTFPRSNELREIARDVPADRLLVETDAPYLAPVPFRGKRNEPAYVAHTAKCWPRSAAGAGRRWPT